MNFSEQCLAFFSSNTDGSTAHERLRWVEENPLYKETDCPYDDRKNGRNNIPDLSKAEKIFISQSLKFFHFSQKHDNALDNIRDSIRLGSPVAISVYISGDSWQTTDIIAIPTAKEISASCIINPKKSKPECKSHSILITGFNDEEQYLEFKNSWGRDWPISGPLKGTGYGRISFGYFNKMKTNGTYLVSAWRYPQ